MKPYRSGQKKKLHFRHDPLRRWAVPVNAFIIDDNIVIPELTEILGEFLPKDCMKLVVKRYGELKARGYPEKWIEHDLQKLVEGIV